jgi:hypothetical protein
VLKETWYVSCSPRNPEKIAPELKLLATLEGREWNQRNSEGKLVTQLQFARLLAESDEFEGSISTDPAFSARDRFAPMATYGFAYLDRERRVRITEAGRQLIDGKRPNEVFLRQLLKWQYPSNQHSGLEYEVRPGLFGEKGFEILPFVNTLQILVKTDGLTKREIAMFLLPKRTMAGNAAVVKRILQYRERRNKLQGRDPRRKFDDKVHRSIFRKLYGLRFRRQHGTDDPTDKTVAEDLLRKVRSSIDVADAAMRLFRYTGLLTTHYDRLSIAKGRDVDVGALLSRGWRLVDFYRDTERFYKYYGSATTPALPWDDRDALLTRIRVLELQTREDVGRLRVLGVSRDVHLPDLSNLDRRDIAGLKDLQAELEQARKYADQLLLRIALKDPSRIDDITDMYERILDRDVFDPPLYLEWNTWRAVIALDSPVNVVPYFTLDADLQPVNHAPGKLPDIVGHYADFVVVYEVTLKTGRTQYKDEGEPVAFHVGYTLQQEMKSGKKPVYGVFVAPKIHKGAIEYFFGYLKSQKFIDTKSFLTIIPFTVEQFNRVLVISKSVGALTGAELRSLLDSARAAGQKADDSEEWEKALLGVIAAWEESVIANRLGSRVKPDTAASRS